MASVMSQLGKHYREAKAEVKGEAISRARRLKGLDEINPELVVQNMNKGARAAAPTSHGVTMHDQTLMVFFDDGSLRRAMSKKQTRSQKKAMKKARQHANRTPKN